MSDISNLVASGEIIETKPNVRFGNTFLSDKYRNFAVTGEGMMDKISGEIFIKRAIDGRVVSFYQNEKQLAQSLFDFKVTVSGYTGFVYPETNDKAVFMHTMVDLASINNNLSRDALNSDFTFTSKNQPILNLSKDTNGFLINTVCRYPYHSYIEFIDLMYDEAVKEYTGSNSVFKDENAKFTKYTNWDKKDAILYYTVTVTRNQGTDGKDALTVDYDMSYPIHIGVNSCVIMETSKYKSDFSDSYDEVTVKINKIEYTKLHFMISNKDAILKEFDSDYGTRLEEGLTKYSAPDDIIQVRCLEFNFFADSMSNVTLTDDEFILDSISLPLFIDYNERLALANGKEETDKEINTKAPINHASTDDIYGIGTSSKYGHVKISDTYKSNESGAGLAASQSALYSVYNDLSEDISSLSDTINDLQYVPVTISSLNLAVDSSSNYTDGAGNATIQEKGTTVTGVTLSWDVSPAKADITSQMIDNESVGTDVTVRKKSFTNLSITAAKTYTLKVTDNGSASNEPTTATKTVQILFYNGVYYGVGESRTSYTSSFILSLTRKLRSNKAIGNINVNAGANKYVYFACPTSYGTPSFSVGGFSGGFSKVASGMSFTNSSGYIENYDIWRSDNSALGAITVNVT